MYAQSEGSDENNDNDADGKEEEDEEEEDMGNNMVYIKYLRLGGVDLRVTAEECGKFDSIIRNTKVRIMLWYRALLYCTVLYGKVVQRNIVYTETRVKRTTIVSFTYHTYRQYLIYFLPYILFTLFFTTTLEQMRRVFIRMDVVQEHRMEPHIGKQCHQTKPNRLNQTKPIEKAFDRP